MKIIARIVTDGKVTGIISGPDEIDQVIVVNGRKWRFDFDEHFGPFWLRADGEPRACQWPSKKEVWDEFNKWMKKYNRRKKRKARSGRR